MNDRQLWREIVRQLKAEHRYWFEPHNRTREALGGHCVQVARLLADLVDGKCVRGRYFGPIEVYPNGPHWNWGEDFPRSHEHSWVEVGNAILDPTWWAFTPNERVGIYRFQLGDPRYRMREPVRH